MKNTADYMKDWDYLTDGVKDKFSLRVAIKSHLIKSFGYTEHEAIDCVAFNLARENRKDL